MSSEDFQRALRGRRELRITVKGRRTGKTYTTPVWFVHERGKIHLLPVSGSNTNWYKNVLADPSMTFFAGGKTLRAKAKALDQANQVKETIRMFQTKYGADQIRRWYTKLDVAVEILLPT